MSGVWCILRRELRGAFVSPAAYGLICGYLLVSAFIFFTQLGSFNKSLLEFTSSPAAAALEPPTLNGFVVEGYFHALLLLMVFVIPVMAMRIYADEKRGGTEELLRASPLSAGELTWGKFLGAWVLLALMSFGSFTYPLLLILFGNPEALPILVGMVGVLLGATLFLSFALICATLTHSHMMAGLSSLVTLLLLYMMHIPFEVGGGMVGTIVRGFSPFTHVHEAIQGVLSVQSLGYFTGMILTALMLSAATLSARRQLSE